MKGIIITIVIIILLGGLGFLTYKYEWYSYLFPESERNNEPIPQTKLLFSVKDKESRNYLDAHYILKDELDSEIKRGNVTQSYLTEINLNQNKNYTLIVWNENHYKEIVKIPIKTEEKKTIEVEIKKYGDLIINRKEDLKEGDSTIEVIINYTGFNKISYIGLSWTFSVINAEITNLIDICNKNWTKEGDVYKCLFDNRTREGCEISEDNKTCKIIPETIPPELFYKLNSYYLINKDYEDAISKLRIKYKTLESIDKSDYIEISIKDQEKEEPISYIIPFTE